MTTRGQILRSSVTGNAPAAGTRAPGELWTNFPDLQLGVIDAAKTAQKLVAVRFFSTSANYAAGDFVIQAGKLYFATSTVTAGAFNSGQWSQIAALTDIPALYVLPTASTSVLGGVKIDGSTITINSGVISVPGAVASSTPPIMDGVAAVGVGTTYARADHVHPSDTSRAPLASPVFTGNPTAPTPIAGDNDTSVATTAFVTTALAAQPVAMNDNRIINGDMRIDQRNNGASGTAVTYTIDRWQYSAAQTSKLAWQRVSGSTTFGAAYWLYFQSSSAYTPLTTDYFGALQIIEADMVSDFMWGTANAQPVTLSFWMFSSLAGTFGGSIRNAANTRSYPFSWSAPAASTWTRVAVTIPGDTAGTWAMNGNAGALSVAFDLGCGATFRGPANAWAGANYVGATGSVNVVGTNAAQFAVTGVKLEIGSVATPFNRQSLAKSMADCQRYYQRLQPTLIGYAVAASSVAIAGFYLATPRATPTINIITNACSNVGAPTFSSTPTGMAMSGTVAATGGFALNAVLEASAEL